MTPASTSKHVVIVGGGFAGIACARELARHAGVRITLLDKNNYHQFQPLLYQVATSQLAPAMWHTRCAKFSTGPQTWT